MKGDPQPSRIPITSLANNSPNPIHVLASYQHYVSRSYRVYRVQNDA